MTTADPCCSTLSRYAVWKTIETQTDRWASFGALAVGVCVTLFAMLV